MTFKHVLLAIFVFVAAVALTNCTVDAPTMDQIRDSKLLDRRISETPRQKVVRECQLETDRFRVSCTYCHTTDKINDIQSPDKLQLNKMGERTMIMRTSPTFGLNQDCAACHQSKFQLTRSAEKMFGPGSKGLIQQPVKDN